MVMMCSYMSPKPESVAVTSTSKASKAIFFRKPLMLPISWQRGRIGEYIVKGPMVLGHESSGVVVEVGKHVKHLKPGDRVAMEPGVPCRRCSYCRNGNYFICPDMTFAAMPPNIYGTLSKYYINASDFCYKVPDSVSMEEAALVEPLSVACAVCETAELRPHQTVLVLGCGPIGVLCQAVAKLWGASKVVGVDVVEKRLQVARSFGTDATYVPPRAGAATDPIAHAEAVAAEMNEKLGLGDGPDVVLECSGAEACIQLGVFAAKKGGTLVQAGMGKEVVAFPITAVCTKALSVKGSIRYKPGSYSAAIDLLSGGKVDVKKLITHRYKFDQAEEAFDLVHAGRPDVFKVMIEGVLE